MQNKLSPVQVAQITQARARRYRARLTEEVLEDRSPFGLQGLRRDALQLLKPECIGRLALRLAIWGNRRQIADDGFAAEMVRRHRDWVDEYEVVHLIEKSLWIQGQSDLVMTLTRNPSQIPDSPPPEILKALLRANALHPKATVYFGVPLFGEETTADGLPLPLSAREVREEHQRRIRTAQALALNYGWMCRTALRVVGLPLVMARMAAGVWQAGRDVIAGIRMYRERIRRDARRRRRAMILQEMEYTRYGRSWSTIPEHSTLLGWAGSRGLDAAASTSQRLGLTAEVTGAASAGLAMAKLVHMIYVPMAIVAADPFLFIELPDERGKLRHIGHWYWQGSTQGPQKLHLHV